jgi:hypothetical protein
MKPSSARTHHFAGACCGSGSGLCRSLLHRVIKVNIPFNLTSATRHSRRAVLLVANRCNTSRVERCTGQTYCLNLHRRHQSATPTAAELRRVPWQVPRRSDRSLAAAGVFRPTPVPDQVPHGLREASIDRSSRNCRRKPTVNDRCTGGTR